MDPGQSQFSQNLSHRPRAPPVQPEPLTQMDPGSRQELQWGFVPPHQALSTLSWAQAHWHRQWLLCAAPHVSWEHTWRGRAGRTRAPAFSSQTHQVTASQGSSILSLWVLGSWPCQLWQAAESCSWDQRSSRALLQVKISWSMNSVSFIFTGTQLLFQILHTSCLSSYEGFTSSQLKEGLVSSLCLPGVAHLAVHPHSATIMGFSLFTGAAATLPGRNIPGCLNRSAGLHEAGKLPISAA